MLVMSPPTHDFHMLTGSVGCAYQMIVPVLCCFGTPEDVVEMEVEVGPGRMCN